MGKQIVFTPASERSDEVNVILAGLLGITREKSGKLVVKSFGYDKRLNSFLNADFSKGLTVFTQKEKREKMFKAVESWGITDHARKQALIINMAQSDVEEQVREKIAEVTLNGKLPMNEEQKTQFDKQVKAYRSFLEKDMNAGICEFGIFLGIAAEKAEPVKEAKVAEKAA